MHETILHIHWDSLLMGIPFLILLLVGIFRLDELVAKPKHRVRRERSATGVDSDGRTIFSDPDGRRWHAPAVHK